MKTLTLKTEQVRVLSSEELERSNGGLHWPGPTTQTFDLTDRLTRTTRPGPIRPRPGTFSPLGGPII